MRRRALFSLITSVCAGSVVSTLADTSSARRRPRSYTVRLVNRQGHGLPTFWHAGKRWVLGAYGAEYGIRVQNHTGRRVEAVVTVDGRDAINGSPGSLTNRGYVLSPYGSVTIRGFRQSLQSVAAFRFTSPTNSYSARMGSPENVGVIGVAFFAERRRPRPRPRLPVRPIPHSTPRAPATGAEPEASHDRGSADAARGTGSAERKRAKRKQSSSGRRPSRSRDNLGTEYGQSEYSPVEEVVFRRESQNRPAQVQRLRYDNAEGLRARGIEPFPRPRPIRRSEPEAFPESRFAPPPPYSGY